MPSDSHAAGERSLLNLQLLRIVTCGLLLVAAVYHARGHYCLAIREETPQDLRHRWREQQSIISGATLRLQNDRKLPRRELAKELGFVPIRNVTHGGYPTWSFVLGYVLYSPPWPAVRAERIRCWPA